MKEPPELVRYRNLDGSKDAGLPVCCVCRRFTRFGMVLMARAASFHGEGVFLTRRHSGMLWIHCRACGRRRGWKVLKSILCRMS